MTKVTLPWADKWRELRKDLRLLGDEISTAKSIVLFETYIEVMEKEYNERLNGIYRCPTCGYVVLESTGFECNNCKVKR